MEHRAGRAGDEHDTGRPRRAAAPATAYPIRPLDRFPMNRTSSMSSNVGPALTTTSRPSSDAGRLQDPLGRRDDVVGLGQAALADPSAGEVARAGIDELHAARSEHRQVSPHGVVLEHVRVHRRRHQDRRARRQVQRAQEVVGDTVSELADDVGGRGGDQQEFGFGGERDVLDVRVRAAGELVGDDRTPGNGFERELADELARRAGHDGGHVVAAPSAARGRLRRPYRRRCRRSRRVRQVP